MSLQAPLGCDFFFTHNLFWMTFKVFRRTGHVFYKMSNCWNVPASSLMMRQRLHILRSKNIGGKSYFYHSLSKPQTILVIYDHWCWPWSFSESCICQVSPLCFHLCFPLCALWEEITMLHTLKELEYIVPCFESRTIF